MGVRSMGYPLITLALIITIFIHEFGHFLALKNAGINVDVFSIGFGPKIFRWRDKNGTKFEIGLLLLGGYIKHSEQQFFNATWWNKIKITLAGVFFNTLIGFVLFWFYLFISGIDPLASIVSSFLASFGLVALFPFVLIKYFSVLISTPNTLIGPVGIIYIGNDLISQQSASVGNAINQIMSSINWIKLIFYLGLINVSVAAVNFLPLPALDGGKAVSETIIHILGKFFGKFLSKRIRSIMRILELLTIVLLVVLLIILTYNDFDLIRKGLMKFPNIK